MSEAYTRAHKFAHISYGLLHKHPWQWEVWAWQVWTKIFQRWGPFLKNMNLTLCQFLKKNLIQYVLWKVSNFALIFYVMQALNKKSSKSLCLSPRNSIGWKFLNIGPVIVHSFVRNTPNFQVYQFTSVSSSAIGTKVSKYLFSL